MKESNDKNAGSCCTCNADFKNEMEELVNDVEGYSKADHQKKQREVRAAFDKKETKPASAAKTATKTTGRTASKTTASKTTARKK